MQQEYFPGIEIINIYDVRQVSGCNQVMEVALLAFFLTLTLTLSVFRLHKSILKDQNVLQAAAAASEEEPAQREFRQQLEKMSSLCQNLMTSPASSRGRSQSKTRAQIATRSSAGEFLCVCLILLSALFMC